MYDTLSNTVTKFRRDCKYAIDQDEAVSLANDIQTDIYNLDLPLFEKRKTDFSTTADDYDYTISSSIGTDVRKIKSIFLDLANVSSPSTEDYNVKQVYRFKYFGFTHNDTTLYLEDDPEGYDLTVIYYRTPSAISTISSSIDLPSGWKKGIYLGLMAEASQRELELPSGDWMRMYEMFLDKLGKTERKRNRGASTVNYYSVI